MEELNTVSTKPVVTFNLNSENILSEPTTVQPTVAQPTIVQPSDVLAPVSFFQLLLNKINQNRNYIYIGLVVVSLAIAGYYLYRRSKKETLTNLKFDNKGKDNNEYYILDASGTPVRVLPNQNIIQNPETESRVVHNIDLPLPPYAETPRPKIQHPDPESDTISNNTDIELARIQANEDENVAQQNLTNSELAEISRNLENFNVN